MILKNIQKKILYIFVIFLYFISHALHALPEVTSLNNQEKNTQQLSSSDRSNEAVLTWAEQMVKMVFSYNWVDYKEVTEKAKSYFVKQGYDHYLKSLKDSGMTESVINKKLILKLKNNGPSKLLKEGVYQGQYAWQVEVPVVFVYYSVTGEVVNVKAKIALLIVRASPIDYKDGIAVAQLVLKPDK